MNDRNATLRRYSWKRCLSSQTLKAASNSALVRVSVPAAAIVVAGSGLAPLLLPLRPRPRPRLCPLVFLTRRAADSLNVRCPLLFIKSLLSLVLFLAASLPLSSRALGTADKD